MECDDREVWNLVTLGGQLDVLGCICAEVSFNGMDIVLWRGLSKLARLWLLSIKEQ